MWAEISADQIIDISARAPETKLSEATQFRQRLVELLTYHHSLVQERERDKLSKAGATHLRSELDQVPDVEDPVAEIVRLARGLSFEGHFANPQTQDYLRSLLASNFATVMHIERSLFADKNPRSRDAKAFRARHHPGGVL